jgi:hypothetical protein
MVPVGPAMVCIRIRHLIMACNHRAQDSAPTSLWLTQALGLSLGKKIPVIIWSIVYRALGSNRLGPVNHALWAHAKADPSRVGFLQSLACASAKFKVEF